MHRSDLLQGELRGLVTRYLFSSVAGMAMISLYILCDTIFIGRSVGSQGLGALNIVLPVFNIIFGTGLLLGIGGATALAICLGQGKTQEGNRIFTHTVLLAGVLAGLYGLVGLAFLEPLSYALGASPANIALVQEYLGVIIAGGFSFIFVNTLTPFVRTDGGYRLAMWATMSGGFVNIILDGIFLFIFHWGMWGAALATVISTLLTLVVLLTHFLPGRAGIKLTRSPFRFPIIRRVVQNGFPSFVVELATGMVILAFNHTLLRFLGDIGVAAYGIIANITLVGVAIFSGIGQGLQPIISTNYGAGQLGRVNGARRLGFLCALALGLAFFTVGKLFPEQLVNLFVKDSGPLLAITVQGIQYSFAGFLLMGVNIVLAAYFQAIEYPVYGTVVSVGRGLVFVLVGLTVLPPMLGVPGIWLTIPFAEGLTFLLALLLVGAVTRQQQGVASPSPVPLGGRWDRS